MLAKNIFHSVALCSTEKYTMKLNWSCTSCGMTSSRRFSVQRHIDNYNIHNGLGKVVSFVEYSMGIKEGRYHPPSPPQFTRAQTPFFDRPLDKITVEVEYQIIREVAKRIYNKISQPKHKEFFDKLESAATDNLIRKNLNDVLNETNL